MAEDYSRTKFKTSLEERLLRFAQEARIAAETTAPGPARDTLIQKARSAEIVANAANRLSE